MSAKEDDTNVDLDNGTNENMIAKHDKAQHPPFFEFNKGSQGPPHYDNPNGGSNPPPHDGCSEHPCDNAGKKPEISGIIFIVVIFIMICLVIGIKGFSIDFEAYENGYDNETTIYEEELFSYNQAYYDDPHEEEETFAEDSPNLEEEVSAVEEVANTHITIKIGEIRLSDTDKTYSMKYERGYLYIYAIPAEIFEYYGEGEDEFTKGLEYDIYECLPESINSYGNVELIAEKVQDQFYTISSWEYPQELRLEIITL